MANNTKTIRPEKKATRPQNGTGQSSTQIIRQDKNSEPMGKINFILMGICGLMIVLGFLLMCGPSSDINHFEPDIFSTRRIVVGPTITFLGFVLMVVAILADPDTLTRIIKRRKTQND